jgi:hypothetical protein
LNHLVSVLLVLVVSGWSDLSRNLHNRNQLKVYRPDRWDLHQPTPSRTAGTARLSQLPSQCKSCTSPPPPRPLLRRASHRTPIRANALAFGLDGVRTVHVLSYIPCLTGTVRQDWICVRVAPLDRP